MAERAPAVEDGDHPAVAKLGAKAGDGHAAEGRPAEVEVGVAVGAVPTGALVGDDDGHRPAGADALVHDAPHLVARATSFAVLEQHRAHRPHPRPQRPHVDQRPIPASPP